MDNRLLYYEEADKIREQQGRMVSLLSREAELIAGMQNVGTDRTDIEMLGIRGKVLEKDALQLVNSINPGGAGEMLLASAVQLKDRIVSINRTLEETSEKLGSAAALEEKAASIEQMVSFARSLEDETEV